MQYFANIFLAPPSGLGVLNLKLGTYAALQQEPTDKSLDHLLRMLIALDTHVSQVLLEAGIPVADLRAAGPK